MSNIETLRYKKELVLNEEELLDFIYRSKMLGFAKTDIKVSQSDGSSLYSNRELPWLYTDTYCGNTIERGQEDVYYDMVLVWSMQYRGGYYIPYWKEAEALSIFLKEALLRTPKQFPFRGPEEFSLDQITFGERIIDGKFLYHNQWEGNIGHFVGREFIYWRDDLVFYHDYMGGIVRNKYFPVRLVTADSEHESKANDQALRFYPDRRLTNPPR